MFKSNFPGVANPPNAYNTNTQDKRFIVRDTSIIDSSSGDKCVYCRFDDIELTNITSLTNTNSLFPTIPTVHTGCGVYGIQDKHRNFSLNSMMSPSSITMFLSLRSSR